MLLHWVWMLWYVSADIAAAVCCIWALWRGGWTERAGALVIGGAWVLTYLTENPGQGPSLGNVIVDIVTLACLAVLALWSRRLWLIFATILQLNTVFAHFVHPFTVYGNYSYATVTGVWSGWGLLICLGLGIIGYRRDLNRAAARRSARTSGPA